MDWYQVLVVFGIPLVSLIALLQIGSILRQIRYRLQEMHGLVEKVAAAKNPLFDDDSFDDVFADDESPELPEKNQQSDVERLEAELHDLEHFLDVGLVPKKDIKSHKTNIENHKQKIEKLKRRTKKEGK